MLWPRRQVKEGFTAFTIATADGKIRQGYKLRELEDESSFATPPPAEQFQIKRTDFDELRAGWFPHARRPCGNDVNRSNAATWSASCSISAAPAHGDRPPATMAHSHAWPNFLLIVPPSSRTNGPPGSYPVNRERIYDFYAKEAEYFRKQEGSLPAPAPVPRPGRRQHGHWGNQNEDTWADSRWNQTDLGTLLCGIFRGAGVTVPKGVCVRLGDHGELAACFNPETLCYEAVWKGGFVKFSARSPRPDGGPDHGRHCPPPTGRPPA